jgi:hypothetical protein
MKSKPGKRASKAYLEQQLSPGLAEVVHTLITAPDQSARQVLVQFVLNCRQRGALRMVCNGLIQALTASKRRVRQHARAALLDFGMAALPHLRFALIQSGRLARNRAAAEVLTALVPQMSCQERLRLCFDARASRAYGRGLLPEGPVADLLAALRLANEYERRPQ